MLSCFPICRFLARWAGVPVCPRWVMSGWGVSIGLPLPHHPGPRCHGLSAMPGRPFPLGGASCLGLFKDGLERRYSNLSASVLSCIDSTTGNWEKKQSVVILKKIKWTFNKNPRRHFLTPCRCWISYNAIQKIT